MFRDESYRPTRAEINFKALDHNLRFLRNRCENKNIQIIGIVKADAYGHGAAPILKKIMEAHVHIAAVSSLDEALELREVSQDAEILILSPVRKKNYPLLYQNRLSVTAESIEDLNGLEEYVNRTSENLNVHIKIDTGMGRLGISDIDAGKLNNSLEKINQLQIEGIFTHFPAAESDRPGTLNQVKKFKKLLSQLPSKIYRNLKYIHIANSAGICFIPESTGEPFNCVRPGLAMYGYSDPQYPVEGLINVMSLKSAVMTVKKHRKGDTVSYSRTYQVKDDVEMIAVIPVGYADGIPVSYSNQGEVLIKKRRYPVAGRVCMDYMMVSLGKNPDHVKAGDDVEIFGGNTVSVEKFAEKNGLIPYEVVCGVSKRVPRVYLN